VLIYGLLAFSKFWYTSAARGLW